jgi:hypothetical protein
VIRVEYKGLVSFNRVPDLKTQCHVFSLDKTGYSRDRPPILILYQLVQLLNPDIFRDLVIVHEEIQRIVLGISSPSSHFRGNGESLRL